VGTPSVRLCFCESTVLVSNRQVIALKNASEKSISIMVSSRVFAGIRSGSFWQHNLMIAVSKSGARRTGSSRLKFANLLRTLLEVLFFDDSGERVALRPLINLSPSTTSWSPDGAHITASNATNNKGFVFIAAVIARNSWTSEISLVGHENTVEVAVSVYSSNACSRNELEPRH
jgi:hypothetical protein